MNCGFTYFIRDKSVKNLIYYGSSCEPTLEDRINNHINKYNTWKNSGKTDYIYSFNVLELNNYEYGIIDVVYFDDKWDLYHQERLLIENNECVNKYIPTRTYAEWYEDNKEQKLKQRADYYEENKDKINKKFVCGCGGKYTHQHKARHIKSQKHQKWEQSQSSISKIISSISSPNSSLSSSVKSL